MTRQPCGANVWWHGCTINPYIRFRASYECYPFLPKMPRNAKNKALCPSYGVFVFLFFRFSSFLCLVFFSSFRFHNVVVLYYYTLLYSAQLYLTLLYRCMLNFVPFHLNLFYFTLPHSIPLFHSILFFVIFFCGPVLCMVHSALLCFILLVIWLLGSSLLYSILLCFAFCSAIQFLCNFSSAPSFYSTLLYFVQSSWSYFAEQFTCGVAYCQRQWVHMELRAPGWSWLCLGGAWGAWAGLRCAHGLVEVTAW